LELVLSTSASVFGEGVPDVPLTGFEFGKDGEINFNMNLYVDLRLKNNGKAIRHFYIPF
jgi:hypothetical protein